MVETFYAHKFIVNPGDVKSGDPALFRAVLDDDYNQAKRLLEKGADPNDVYTFDDPDFCQEKTIKRLSVPLVAAKSLNMVKLLVEHGASVDTRFLEKESRIGRYVPLIEKVRWGHVDIVEYLLQQPDIYLYDHETR